MDNSKIIIIVPALNEERNIADVIDRVNKVLPGVSTLVINDGSTDLTKEKALSKGAKVISFPFTLGIGAAMQAGFMYAFDNKYDIAIQVDGDGQHRPEDLTLLLDAVYSEDVDMVIGSRYIEKKGYMSSIQRRAGIKIFAVLISKIIRQKVSDPTSGFRVINKKAIELFANDYPEDYPEPESLVVAHLKGLKMKEVPVCMQQREFGLSSITFFSSFYYMIKVTLAILIDLIRYKKK